MRRRRAWAARRKTNEYYMAIVLCSFLRTITLTRLSEVAPGFAVSETTAQEHRPRSRRRRHVGIVGEQRRLPQEQFHGRRRMVSRSLVHNP